MRRHLRTRTDTMLFLEAAPNHVELLEVCPSGITFRSGDRAGQPIGEVGLWTRADLPAGKLLGFYTGRASDDFDKYSVALSEDFVSMTPLEEGSQQPDFSMHPLAAINEPADGEAANVFVRSELHELASPSELGVVVPFYTAVPVPANTELKWHYGESYAAHRHGYIPGTPAAPLPVPKVARGVVEALLSHRPDAIHCLPPDPSDEDSDEEWR